MSFKLDILNGTDAKYFIFGILVICSIGLYGKYRCDNIDIHKDILGWEIFKNSSKYGLDGWSISHFIYFFIVGYYYPKTFVLSMMLGIIWELFEAYIGYYKPKAIQNYGFCKVSSKLSSKVSKINNNVWWYGKWSDIIINYCGFATGKYLRTH